MHLLVLWLGIHLANAVDPTPTPVVQFSDELYSDPMSNMNTMRHHENWAAGTPLPVTGVVQIVQAGPIPTPTYVSLLTLTIGDSITPVAGATATAKRIKVKRGKWLPGTSSIQIRECNVTGTPGPLLSNTEAVFTSPAEVCIQKWYIPVSTGTPVNLDFEYVESP